MLQLREDLAFQLKNLLLSIPKDKLGEQDGSTFRAVTMRRKLVEILKASNAAYEGRVEAVDALVKAAQDKVNANRDEINALPGSDEEKLAESSKFAKEVDTELIPALQAVGEVLFVQKPSGNLLMLKSDAMVDLDLEDRHVDFLKERVDKHGIDAFIQEDDLVAVGEALGM